MRYFVAAAIVLSCSMAMADDCLSGMCPTPKRDPIHYTLDNLAQGWFEPAIEVHESFP